MSRWEVPGTLFIDPHVPLFRLQVDLCGRQACRLGFEGDFTRSPGGADDGQQPALVGLALTFYIRLLGERVAVPTAISSPAPLVSSEMSGSPCLTTTPSSSTTSIVT